MTGNNSFWGRTLQTSSAELADLRRKWGDAGQEAWNAATRLGHDVKARTQQELETLGRRALAQAEQEQAANRALRGAVGSTLRAGADLAQRGGAAALRGVQSTAKSQLDLERLKEEQAQRATLSAARATIGAALGQGTPADPKPGRLFNEFTTGKGPQARVLGPDSSFSEEFAKAPSVREYVGESIANWRSHDGGADMYRNPERRNFGIRDFLMDGLAGNRAAHVVGSFGMAGQRRGDTIDWWTENDMGKHSFFAGNFRDKNGMTSVPDQLRPGPWGTTHQTILFSTDLDGNPLKDRR